MDLLYKPKHGFVPEEHPRTSHGFFVVLFFIFLIAYITVGYFKVDLQALTEMTWSIFAAAGILILIFSFINLEMAVLSLVFIVPITTFQLPGIPFHVTLGDAYLLVITTAWLMRLMVKSGQRIEPTPIDKPLFIFVFLSIASIINATRFSSAFTELVQTFEFFIAALYIIHSVLRTNEDFENTLLAMALSCMLFSLLGIKEYFALGAGSTRVQATFGHTNAFGAYLAMMIPLLFNIILMEKQRWRRNVYILSMITAVFAIMFTFSRGAWIGVLFGLLLSGWLRGMTQFIKYFSVGVILIIVISVLIPKELERFTGRAATITEINDNSTQSRLEQYQMALEIMVKSPIFGTGVGQVPVYASKRGTPGLGEIHNLFLHIGADRGIPALLALVFLFFMYYRELSRRIFRSRSTYFRDMYIMNIAVVGSFLVVNLTAYQLVRGLGIFLGLFLGMAAALTRNEDSLSDRGLLEEDIEYEEQVSRSPSLLPNAADRV